MAILATTTTTSTGTVTIATEIKNGDNTVGSITTTIRVDETDGSATEGQRTMDTSFWLAGASGASPYADLKSMADGAASHFDAVSDYIDSLDDSSGQGT